MKRSKFSDEQILKIVREGEAGRKVADLCRTHGITEQTYYRRKAKFTSLCFADFLDCFIGRDPDACFRFNSLPAPPCVVATHFQIQPKPRDYGSNDRLSV